MSKIRVMDEILSNKIAAGEVVERCSSVVKELIENAIDAESTEIKIILKESGVKEIKVIDNGFGMDKEDAVNCFGRHATSKIVDEDDLYHIHTLGFRGEALASIASVSKVTLDTSTGDVGTLVKINGGKIIEVSASDSRRGTTICVNDLFYNTPARLKHLKSLYTELAHITDYINKIALSHPNIRFLLINDDKELLRTDGSGNLLKCISNIYGLKIAKKMMSIENENNDYKISGFISLPEVYKSTRNSIVTIVNGRIVRNTELNRKINDSYHSYKPDNYYPIVVLNIEVDTTLVDVNIHPTKMDIKFGNFEDLLDLVRTTIRNKISNRNLIPEVDEDEIIEKNEETKQETKTYEKIKLDFDTPTINDVEENYVINTFDREEVEVMEESKKMPLMYPVGLVHGTYIICQNDLGMYIVDQHAAKERVNYEIVKDKLNNPKKESIQMVVPLTLEYTNTESIILKENLKFLREMNFDIDEFGINSFIIKSHPVWLPKGNEINSIKKILDLVIEKEKNFDIEKFNDHMAATMACKMSIKGNTSITMEEAENLLEDLKKCNNPFNCPHGRPTIIFYSSSDLEKLFKRSGF